MPNASDIADSIEPGTTEYGDRQVIEERMQQASSQAQASAPARTGATASAAQSRLASGPVSDLPVTDGLSVGPGSSPQTARNPATDPQLEKYRLLAMNARSPVLRKLARNALQASVARGR